MKSIYLLATLLLLVACSNQVKHAAAKGERTATVVETDTNLIVTIDDVTFKMIRVEKGSFQMGSNDGYDREKPIHQVMLDSFYIGETEVTQELWEAVMGSNPSEFKGSKRPVENVSWNNCQSFIAKLNELTGKAFRLPTEAEWEFAARGGNKSRGFIYSGSNTIDEVAWYYHNSYDKGESSPDYGTHEVGIKIPNELGIYDMSGNVYEWCQDWSSLNYDSNSPVNNPTGPTSGSYRECRGGSWYGGDATVCRVAYRCSSEPTHSDSDIGFRLAL